MNLNIPSDFYFIMTSLFLALFCLVGFFDGAYFHLYKYQLHRWAESRTEHWIHTARAAIFIPLSLLLFVRNSSGLSLWIAILLLMLDLILEIVDVMVEGTARKTLGGISQLETLLHVFATAFRFGALALILAQKPLAAWSWNSYLLPEFPMHLQILGFIFCVTSFVGTISQILLVKWPYLMLASRKK